MTPTAVTSTRNPRVVAAAKLHRSRARRQAGLTLVEGPHLLAQAARTGADVETFFALKDDPHIATASHHGWEIITVSEQVLQRLSGTAQPQGPVATVRIPTAGPLPDGNCVVLWGVGDPGNTGTIIRSAAAFGFAVVIGPATADPWAPKVLRAAAGAHFHTWVGAVADPHPGALAPRMHVAAIPAGSTSGLPAAPLALYVGDEAAGLPTAIVAACEREVTVPMDSGVESLNVAVAASILMSWTAGT